MKRPLVPLALLYAGGILVGDHFAVSLSLLLAAGLGLVLVALVWGAARVYILYPLIFLTGWAGMLISSTVISPHDLRTLVGAEPQIVTVRARLTETPTIRIRETATRTNVRSLTKASVSAIQLPKQAWQPAFGKIVIGTSAALTNVFAGQIVEISGVIARPKRAFVEGLFDYRDYLQRLGIYYDLQADSETDWQIIASPGHRPLADRFRDWARAKLAAGLPREDESLRLEWALTLGWKPALTEEVSEPFVRAATYHIFAVDGLRMAIVFGILFCLFRVLGVPRAICGLSLIPIIWFYVALTGWPASAIRASVMLTIVILGWALKRPVDVINSLFAAALLILVWEPQQLFQAGFQLSFFVVLALILIIPVLQDLAKRAFAPDPLLPLSLRRKWHPVIQVPAKYLWGIFLTSLAAWIGSLPLVAYYFNIFTPVSTPANILAVPACALALMANLASLLLAAWFPAASELFNHAGWALMELIRVSSDWFAQLPTAYYYVSAPAWTTTILYYLFLIAIFTGWIFVARGRFWKCALAGLLIGAWTFQVLREVKTTRVTVLPESGAAAIFLDAPGRAQDILVDCGSANSFQSVTKPFLRSRGVNQLGNLVLTHGDVRHTGGAEALNELFDVARIWTSPVHFRSTAYRNAFALFSEIPGKLKTVRSGDFLAGWTVLHPDGEERFSHADDNAIVMVRQIGPARVLLLSDLGRPGQSSLLGRYSDLRADILISGLPTSDEALSDAILDRIQPRLIIVTDSQFPASARASEKLHERLEKRNLPVLFTRSCGSVMLDFTTTEWTLRTMSGQMLTGSRLASQHLRIVPGDRAQR